MSAQRRQAIAEMFRIIESKYGDFSTLVRPTHGRDAVLRTPTLTRTALADLFEHRVAAVHVPGFYPAAAAERLAQRLLTDKSVNRRNWGISVATDGDGAGASDGGANGVGTSESGSGVARGLESTDVWAAGGTPHNVALGGGQAALDQYFDNAIDSMRQLRRCSSSSAVSASASASATVSALEEGSDTGEAAGRIAPRDDDTPVLPPIDQLRLELDEMWPDGATVAKDKATGAAHLAGIGRIMRGPTQWARGFCHADDLSVMSETRGTFSANVYLQMPPNGAGGLSVWDVQINSRWDFYRHAWTLSQLAAQSAEGQARLRERLPAPIAINPRPGDLVLICVQRPHAVDGFSKGTRVSQQVFLTHDRGKPIELDS